MTKPVLYKQAYTLSDDDASYSGNVITGGNAYDADGDALTVANIDGQYIAGTIGGGKGANVVQGDYGTLTIYQDGSYVYTLNAGLNLKAGDTLTEDFSVKIRDTQGNYATSTLKFAINGTTNDKPIAVDDFYTATSGVVTGNILANDSDPDGDVLHVGGVIVNGTNYHITGQSNVEIHGLYGTLTISADGNFSYELDAGVAGSGVEKFAYKPHDGQNGEGNNTDYAVVEIAFGLV